MQFKIFSLEVSTGKDQGSFLVTLIRSSTEDASSVRKNFEEKYLGHKVVSVDEVVADPSLDWQEGTFQDFDGLLDRLGKEDRDALQSMISLLTGKSAAAGFERGKARGRSGFGQDVMNALELEERSKRG